MTITHYRVHAHDGNRNPTGETWHQPFTASDAAFVGIPADMFTANGGLPLTAAQSWCSKQTRASSNHDGAYSYSVVYPKGF